MDKSSVVPDWLVEACNDYPLLWVVYGLLLFLPAVVVVYMLCGPKRLDSAARHKKTDEHTPADTTVTQTKACDPVKDTVATETITDDTTKSDEVKYEKEILKEEATKDDNETLNEETNEDSKTEKEAVKEEEAAKEETESIKEDIAKDSDSDRIEAEDKIPEATKEETESHDQSHDSQDGSLLDLQPEVDEPLNEEMGVVNDEDVCHRWSFPPVLEQFDLMETETDPTELEDIFNDERLREIRLNVTSTGPGLGISIVGGQGSPSGDLPIIVKRVLPGSLAEQDGRLKSGDELVAMNEKILVGVGKDIAINALSNLEGTVRLLVLQDE